MSPQWRKEKDNSGEVMGQKPSTQSCGPFYGPDIKRQNYSVCSYFGIRAGISRYFPRFDIMNCATFTKSEQIFFPETFRIFVHRGDTCLCIKDMNKWILHNRSPLNNKDALITFQFRYRVRIWNQRLNNKLPLWIIILCVMGHQAEHYFPNFGKLKVIKKTFKNVNLIEGKLCTIDLVNKSWQDASLWCFIKLVVL